VTEFVVSSTGTLVYLPDQGLLQSRLAWVDRKTGLKWLNVAGAAGAVFSDDPAISPDGSTLFITARFGDRFRQIYRIDLARGIPQRLTTDGMSNGPVLSPDGREVLFASTSGGYKNLVRRSVSGDTGVTPVTTAKRDHFACGWSRIGRIAYGERLPHDKYRIFTLDLATPEAASQLVTPEGASEPTARLSPDGSRLAYVVNENGTPQVYVRELSPDGRRAGREERVSAAGGTSPRWRPDGSELVYLSPDERRFLAIPIGAGHSLQVESESILYELPAEIRLAASFEVAADGRLFIIAREERTTPMDVVVWIGAVPRQ
jgi:Tol biopolymer transport system component